MEWLWRFVLTAAVQTQKLLCCAVRQCPELRFGPVLFFTPPVICYKPLFGPCAHGHVNVQGPCHPSSPLRSQQPTLDSGAAAVGDCSYCGSSVLQRVLAVPLAASADM